MCLAGFKYLLCSLILGINKLEYCSVQQELNYTIQAIGKTYPKTYINVLYLAYEIFIIPLNMEVWK